MDERPVDGPVPRLELIEWGSRFGIRAGITVPGDGPEPFDLGLAGRIAPTGAVIPRWREFLASMAPFSGIVISHQVHGTTIRVHERVPGILLAADGDGHLTSSPGLLLAVSVADCIPVYVADPARRAVALVHAGWRGTAGGILPRAIGALRERGSRVENLWVHCGIGICGRCYEVGPEVFEACGVPVPAGGKGALDLRGVLLEQVRRAGVENVSTSGYCSAHGPGRFFSHRASRGADGRMVAYLGLTP
ncbi:MAG TPA: polyphenol oxidase family protein [Gemmatimonadales bacterium]|nr:polyphenol oxidase family protein [Gemmatimonadales bacterium]